jgi:hypothetical protein
MAHESHWFCTRRPVQGFFRETFFPEKCWRSDASVGVMLLIGLAQVLGGVLLGSNEACLDAFGMAYCSVIFNRR